MVYAVSSVESIRAYGLPFVFTDGHSLANFTAWFETLEDLRALDWDTIGARSWHDTLDDPDRQRRKQAEILVHEFVPLKALLGFAAMTREARDEVQTKLQERGVELPVAVRREWYY